MRTLTPSSDTLDRRRLLKGAAALACGGAAAPAGAADADPALRAALATIADEILRLSPEQASQLGVDHDRYRALKSELSDVGPAGDAAWAAEARSVRARLSRLDRQRLSPLQVAQLDSTLYAADRALEGLAFSYGGGAAAGFGGGAEPYVVSQQNGAVVSVPEFLATAHQIRDQADLEAYLARVEAMGRQISQETDRIRADAGRGVAPPQFIAETTLAQLKAFRATPAAAQRMAASLKERAAAAGVVGEWSERCAGIIDRSVYPALDRQIAAFSEATSRARTTAGVGRLPNGQAFYDWALRLGTTTPQTPGEVHAIGLRQNAEIKSRLEALLRHQGLTSGTVGQRVQALNKDPRFLYPDTDAGRADLIAYLNGCIAKIRPLMPQLSHLGLRADVQVKRVPVDIQDGAALGYMNFAALDGSRPAIYYVNLKSTALWPKYQLPTLTAHEGIPGHTWQGAYLAERHDQVPLTASLISFNAFVEGWALYAEQLVDEQGLYADNPFGEIGYLQAQQFRACRLVADTGLHALGWTREQSVAFLSEETGKGRDAMTSETDRYCVSPGQACGYKIGHNEILRLRERARAELGARFDLAGFDDAVVETGGCPLPVLSSAIDGYIARVRAA